MINSLMKIYEVDATYYTPEDDRYSQLQLDDTRRPRITLAHLNKLKKMRAARQLENLVRRDVLELIYGSPEEGGGQMPGL
jgi:hypothetical protein